MFSSTWPSELVHQTIGTSGASEISTGPPLPLTPALKMHVNVMQRPSETVTSFRWCALFCQKLSPKELASNLTVFYLWNGIVKLAGILPQYGKSTTVVLGTKFLQEHACCSGTDSTFHDNSANLNQQGKQVFFMSQQSCIFCPFLI